MDRLWHCKHNFQIKRWRNELQLQKEMRCHDLFACRSVFLVPLSLSQFVCVRASQEVDGGVGSILKKSLRDLTSCKV